MHPVLDAVLLLGNLLVQAAGRLRDHFLFRGGERTGLVGEAVDRRRIAVGRDQRRECLHQVPGRAVNHGFQAGVDVFSRARPHFSPLETSSSSTTPLAPSVIVTLPSRSCSAEGM